MSGSAARLALNATSALALTACPGPSFRDGAPAERPAWVEGDLDRALVDPGSVALTADAHAFPRPEVEVLPSQALGAEPLAVTVIGHDRAGPSYRLALRAPDGSAFEIRYRVANGLELPLAPDERIMLSRWGDGLVASDIAPSPASRFRFILAVDPPPTGDERLRALADLVQPAFASDRLVYGELGAAASGCVWSIDHHALEVRVPVVGAPETRTLLPPGRALRVRLGADGPDAQDAILFALDASRPTPRRAAAPDQAPRCGAPAHVSWLVVSTPATAPIAP